MDYFSKNKISLWIIVILVLLNLFTLSTIWYDRFHIPDRFPRPEGRHQRQDGLKRLERKLNLTADQIKIFESLRQQHFEKMVPLHQEIFSIRRELMDEVIKTEPDTARIRELTSRIGVKETERERNIIEHFTEMRSVCTPAQREKFESLLRELMCPPSEMPGPHPGRQEFRHGPEPGTAPAMDDTEFFFR
jgi:Spy/CpxP family protein refolding chaperone